MPVLRVPSALSSGELWFRRRPRLALAVAGVLFAGVFTLRMSTGTPIDAYSMLYALPVALVAISSGLRAGTAAGVLAVALTALYAVVEDVSLTAAGWVSRVLPMLLLGVLVGHATDRDRRAELERRRLHAAAILHREAIEINDSLVQGMAAARWSIDAGQVEHGVQILERTIAQAQDMVSDLIRRADMGTRAEELPLRGGDERFPQAQ